MSTEKYQAFSDSATSTTIYLGEAVQTYVDDDYVATGYFETQDRFSQQDIYIAVYSSLIGNDWSTNDDRLFQSYLDFAGAGSQDETKELTLSVGSIKELSLPITVGGYTHPVTGSTMPASTQRISFSGTFTSTTESSTGKSLQSPDYGTVVHHDDNNPETYHIWNGTTWGTAGAGNVAYTLQIAGQNFNYRADTGLDDFANIEYKLRIVMGSATTQTIRDYWETTPTLTGDITASWWGDRFIIDGADGDTPPTIAVNTQLVASAVKLESGIATLSTTSTMAVTGNVNYSGQTTLTSDAQMPDVLSGISVSITETIASDFEVTAQPGYLFSNTETLEANSVLTGLGGNLIGLESLTVAGDSQVVAQAGYVKDSGSLSIASDSQQTALGNTIYGPTVNLASDTFGTITARADIFGEIVLASQFTLDYVPGNKIFADADIAADVASQQSAGVIRAGLATVQSDSQQTATGGRIYLIDEILSSNFNFTGTEITDLVTGAAILNAGSFQLTTGRNWLIDRYYTLIVPDENRDYQVLPETRVVIVEDENRNYLIKTETRALEVEQETRVRPDPIAQGLITDRRTERV